MTENQARVLMRALDLYSRVRMGQFRTISYLFTPYREFDWTVVDYHLDATKRAIFPELDTNAYYGIFNDEVGDAKNAWDIHQVVRHALAWHRNLEGGITVDFDEPWATSDEPLPTIELED